MIRRTINIGESLKNKWKTHKYIPKPIEEINCFLEQMRSEEKPQKQNAVLILRYF